MIKIDLVGMDKMQAMLRGVEKQVRFANMVATNRAAFKGRDAIQREMDKSFDRVTPWVKGGVRVVKATKASPAALIDLDFWGNKQGVAVESILKPEIKGGGRKHKRHELALQRAGILPDGMYIVPGEAAVIDQYGNMGGGQINQIIAWFRAFGEQGYQANMSDKRRKALGRDNKRTGKRGVQYFAIGAARNGLMPGVYQRVSTGFGSSIRPVMIFVRRPQYKRRLDFYGVGERAARAEFAAQFPIAFSQAMASAR